MKIAVFCNTYFQLLFALQMRLTILNDDNVDIIISDQSKGSQVIAERLDRKMVFNNCYYVRTKAFGKVHSIIDGINGKHTFDFLQCKYDHLFIHNIDVVSYALFSRLYAYNRSIKVSRFEEGILSYDRRGMDSIDKKKRVVTKIRHGLGKPVIEDVIEDFYCFYPSVYAGDLQAIEVPKIHPGDEIGNILNWLFSLKESDLSEYTRQYIFFTSVYDFEGGAPIGEYDLVCKIALLVGKENLMIKTHPRDRRSIYQEAGFCVDKNASIPWEVIQIIGDFNDKKYITATSGSVLAGSFMTDTPVKTLYVYKLCDLENNKAAQISARNIENILNVPDLKGLLRNVSIVEKIEDILL